MQEYVYLSVCLLLRCVLHVLGETTCPPPEDVSPCVCLQGRYSFDILCKRGNLKDLENVVRQLQGKKVGEMHLDGLDLERLPSDLFQGLHVQKLVIIDCDLKGIADADGKPSFVGLENSLRVLKIIDSIKGANQLKTIDLSHLKKLRDLDLSENNIPEMDNNWFKNGPYSLQSISLDATGLRSVGDRVFQPLINLADLSVSDAYINTAVRSMLPNPANKLDTFYLVNISLSSLPEDAFSGMPSLKYVYLSQNLFTQLPSTTWSPVWAQLVLLALDGNPFVCDSHIEWTFSVKRPAELDGTCSSPETRKNKQLKDLIDDSKE